MSIRQANAESIENLGSLFNEVEKFNDMEMLNPNCGLAYLSSASFLQNTAHHKVSNLLKTPLTRVFCIINYSIDQILGFRSFRSQLPLGFHRMC
jgi:hypothetical protein